MLDLSRPPVASSPRPRCRYAPSPAGPMPRAMSASARMFTTDARSLARRALGQVGVGAVQRLGDDDAEHRVAEELQPLVVRQAAVLVGVGAVGQGAPQQLGVQFDAERGRRGRPGRRLRARWHAAAEAGLRPRGPACRRTGRSWRTRCAAASARRTPGSGRATSVGALVFHCDRRDRVLLREVFRFGTATSVTPSSWVVLRCARCPRRPARAAPPSGGRSVMRVVGRQLVQPLPAGGAQPGAVRPAQRGPGQAQDDRVTHHRFEIERSPSSRWTSSASVVSSVALSG